MVRKRRKTYRELRGESGKQAWIEYRPKNQVTPRLSTPWVLRFELDEYEQELAEEETAHTCVFPPEQCDALHEHYTAKHAAAFEAVPRWRISYLYGESQSGEHYVLIAFHNPTDMAFFKFNMYGDDH
jgi:hypothetical protein